MITVNLSWQKTPTEDFLLGLSRIWLHFMTLLIVTFLPAKACMDKLYHVNTYLDYLPQLSCTRHNFHYLTMWTLAGDVTRSSLFNSWLDILGHLSTTCRGHYKYGNPGADVNNTAALKRASLKILAVWGRNTYRYSYRQFYPCLAFHRWSAQQRWRCESWDDLCYELWKGRRWFPKMQGRAEEGWRDIRLSSINCH